jgi:hypothetical protein
VLQYADLTPTSVLVSRFLLEAQLSSPGSISGHQLRQAQGGLGGRPPDGGRLNLQDELHARLGDLLLLCRDLNALEQRVCRARYGTTSGVEYYTRLRRPCDMRDGDGEDVIDARPTDPDGKPIEGFVRTRGPKGRFPDFDEIAAQLGLERRVVRSAVETARSKIATAIKWRAFAAATEAAYE